MRGKLVTGTFTTMALNMCFWTVLITILVNPTLPRSLRASGQRKIYPSESFALLIESRCEFCRNGSSKHEEQYSCAKELCEMYNRMLTSTTVRKVTALVSIPPGYPRKLHPNATLPPLIF